MQSPSSSESFQNSRSATRSSLSSSRLSLVRLSVGVILADLLVQFLLGMWLNLFASFANMPGSLFSMSGMIGSGMGMSNMMMTMSASMAVLMIHMLNGYLLGILSIIALALSLYSKKVGISSLGVAGFASILLAGISGLSFMFSGFQNNAFSYLMAVGFVAALFVYFVELYLLRR